MRCLLAAVCPEARRIRPVKYPYPKGLHFYQIRHLARLLNSRSGGVRDHNQRVEAEVTDKNYDVPKCEFIHTSCVQPIQLSYSTK